MIIAVIRRRCGLYRDDKRCGMPRYKVQNTDQGTRLTANVVSIRCRDASSLNYHPGWYVKAVFEIMCCLTFDNKKLSYRREAARCFVSVRLSVVSLSIRYVDVEGNLLFLVSNASDSRLRTNKFCSLRRGRPCWL